MAAYMEQQEGKGSVPHPDKAMCMLHCYQCFVIKIIIK